MPHPAARQPGNPLGLWCSAPSVRLTNLWAGTTPHPFRTPSGTRSPERCPNCSAANFAASETGPCTAAALGSRWSATVAWSTRQDAEGNRFASAPVRASPSESRLRAPARCEGWPRACVPGHRSPRTDHHAHLRQDRPGSQPPKGLAGERSQLRQQRWRVRLFGAWPPQSSLKLGRRQTNDARWPLATVSTTAFETSGGTSASSPVAPTRPMKPTGPYIASSGQCLAPAALLRLFRSPTVVRGGTGTGSEAVTDEVITRAIRSGLGGPPIQGRFRRAPATDFARRR